MGKTGKEMVFRVEIKGAVKMTEGVLTGKFTFSVEASPEALEEECLCALAYTLAETAKKAGLDIVTESGPEPTAIN